MTEEADACDVGEGCGVVPHGDGVGDFVFDGHELHFAFATPVSAKVEADGCYAFFGE